MPLAASGFLEMSCALGGDVPQRLADRIPTIPAARITAMYVLAGKSPLSELMCMDGSAAALFLDDDRQRLDFWEGLPERELNATFHQRLPIEQRRQDRRGRRCANVRLVVIEIASERQGAFPTHDRDRPR